MPIPCIALPPKLAFLRKKIHFPPPKKIFAFPSINICIFPKNVLPLHPNSYPSVPEGHPKVARRSPEGQPKIRRMSNAGESQVTRDHHVTILLLLYEARIRIIQETMKMNIFFGKNALFLFNKQ